MFFFIKQTFIPRVLDPIDNEIKGLEIGYLPHFLSKNHHSKFPREHHLHHNQQLIAPLGYNFLLAGHRWGWCKLCVLLMIMIRLTGISN